MNISSKALCDICRPLKRERKGLTLQGSLHDACFANAEFAEARLSSRGNNSLLLAGVLLSITQQIAVNAVQSHCFRGVESPQPTIYIVCIGIGVFCRLAAWKRCCKKCCRQKARATGAA